MDIPAVGGIVFDDRRRLLLVQRARPPAALAWSVPGGKCLPGERAEEACVRELAEETGLTVRIERFAGRVFRPAPAGHRFVIDDYLCVETGGNLRAGDDALQVGWFRQVDLAELDLVAGLCQALTDWGLLPE